MSKCGSGRRVRILLSAVGVALVLASGVYRAAAQTAKAPRFEDYRVSNIYKGPVKPLHLADPKRYADDRCVGGEAPAGYVPGPVNFAGHFVIETCTCGSGCHYLYLWDAVTGKFYGFFPYKGPIDVGPYGIDLPMPVEYKGEEFHVDSSLLILEGCIEDTCDCARRYYNWTADLF